MRPPTRANEYRSLAKRYASHSDADRRRVFEALSMKWSTVPLSVYERSIGRQLAAHVLVRGPTWFHGGMTGRAVGNMLLPPRVTGADPRCEGDVAPIKAGFVYVTWSPEMAAWYAERNRAAGTQSEVYRVEPQGTPKLDPELLRMAILHSFDREKLSPPEMWQRYLYSFTCESAKVVEVLKAPEPVR
jgi:hypothetical protein